MIAPHPAQLVLDGRAHAEAHRGPTMRQRRVYDGWLSALAEPRTVAELAAAWWPEIGEPRAWRVKAYPRKQLRAAWSRVRTMERHGLVLVGRGPLRHRNQVGAQVMRARTRQWKIGGGGR